MKNFGTRYILSMVLIVFLFVNFVACGSQLYQMSMKDDLDEDKISSEAKDPTSTLYGIHAPSGWQSLPIAYKLDSSMDATQKSALQAAMKTWEKTVGKALFKFNGVHSGVTGDSFKDLYSSLKDSTNGYYLDADWGKTSKPTVVLATTIWDNSSGDTSMIASADIRFNKENYLIGDSLTLTATQSREVVDMQSLALHELGHLLGLAHIDPQNDNLSIMNPQLFIGEGLTSRILSKGDIERIQTIYGCDGDACDQEKVLEEIQKDNGVNTTVAH